MRDKHFQRRLQFLGLSSQRRMRGIDKLIAKVDRYLVGMGINDLLHQFFPFRTHELDGLSYVASF